MTRSIPAAVFALVALAGCAAPSEEAESVAVQPPAETTVEAPPVEPAPVEPAPVETPSTEELLPLAMQMSWDSMDYETQMEICFGIGYDPDLMYQQFTAGAEMDIPRDVFDDFFEEVC